MHWFTGLSKIVTAFVFVTLLNCLALSPAYALYVSPAKDPLVLLNNAFPAATRISEKQQQPPVWEIYQQQDLIGYAFETNDIEPIPAYSGEPVNMLVAIDPQGKYLNAQIIEHHEPIILAGIPESKLAAFAEQYPGLSVKDKIKVGNNKNDQYVAIDGLSGATVTVKVMNAALTKSANEVAKTLGIIKADQGVIQPPSTIINDLFEPASWQQLTGDGSIRRLFLNHANVDKAFIGTEAENIDNASPGEEQQMFAEIYYALADVPTIGRNLFSEKDYQWLMSTLKPDEHMLVVLGNGYSFKGSGYVRGGIFDRIQILQNDNEIEFRDLDHHRITDLAIPGAPEFKEMSVFRIQAHHEFDPGSDWQLELLVRRQTGPIDSIFSSFQAEYDIPDRYVDTPPAIYPEPELSLAEQAWQERNVEIYILSALLLVLIFILFFQDILVRHQKFMHNLRHAFLVVTVVFIGWAWGGQLSIVNVFTFLQALMKDFSWDLFLLDPIIFTLWSATAIILLLWGRAVYCGWLCPFGALQELINVGARYIKIPQYELPFAVHERLWAIKYLILLGLFAISLDSLALAEKFAEIEPFKTTFLLKFDREWPFIFWAGLLLVANLFQRKTFCRYLCPLGAALSVSSNIRQFNWLKRRPECGQPCKTCAKECEIQAIHPNGQINMRECHYCLDCQITYYNADKCPPLKKLARKKRRDSSLDIPITETP